MIDFPGKERNSENRNKRGIITTDVDTKNVVDVAELYQKQ